MSFRRSAMEKGLHDRDLVGLQDFVMLEDYLSEDAFIENLRIRFNANLIYTYIGQVLISVNPYKELPIYGEDDIQEYRKRHFFEAPPHIYAICDNAYKSLVEENRAQCILISGESGSGKTEASKKVLQFIAAASGHVSTIDSVRDKLLQSNPVLEAFGNAKTNRNYNSSRFGKYMDVQFNFHGAPQSGNILNYLLEKSRVINQMSGERNFHIFYQLLIGGGEDLLKKLQLERDLNTYYYLTNGVEGHNPMIADSENFSTTVKALNIMEVQQEEQNALFEIVASVLHIGNIGFTEDEGLAKVANFESLNVVAKLLGVDHTQLSEALTHRTIDARGDLVTSPLGREMAIFARDALAKAVYDRLFTWLVSRLNKSLKVGSLGRKNNVMGILDIYGFEIFKQNSFEQFCINFCNEKLQQLFITLTLKSEQEEYLREGIQWETIDYFDNHIICNLIEQKHVGIISVIDEECLRPGDATDLTLLAKMNNGLAEHPHYICHSPAMQKVLNRDEFRLIHYAGDVTYNVNGFLDKNNDLLFRNLKEIMVSATNPIITQCFFDKEVTLKRRPETAVTQFRNSLNKLMDTLLVKDPSYIRCIKPNDQQAPGQFDEELIRHQVKYLGLMENLRVRRAGFAYRRPYDLFLKRYKCLSKNTWPHWKGEPKRGVQVLIETLGYKSDEYRLGESKIFIRHPKTLFATEDAFQEKKHYLASKIQAEWKARQQRKRYLKFREDVLCIQKYMRRYLAQKRAKERREAATVIRAFIKGFITRNDAPNGYNESFIAHSKREWLLRLSKNLPRNVLDHSWISCPAHCAEASLLLRNMARTHLSRVYRLALSADKKKQFQLKVLAENVFKNKKKNYPNSITEWFDNDRVSSDQKTALKTFEDSNVQESILYRTNAIKYDRRGYKPRERFLIISANAVYIIDGKTFKQKHRLPLEKLSFCVSNENDNILVVRIPESLENDKGDLIVAVPQIIECCIWILEATKNNSVLSILDSGSITHSLNKGKPSGVIEIKQGQQSSIAKAKNGNLLVIAASQ